MGHPVLTGFNSRADMNYRFGENVKNVGKSIVSSIGEVTTLRPGFIAKFLEFSLWITFSRTIRIFILSQITKDMTQHQNK